MTPLAIEILLHCHCSPAPWPCPSPAADAEIDAMKNDGILRDNGMPRRFTTTPRGKALVAMLCSTPMPEQVFVDPRDGCAVKNLCISLTAAVDASLGKKPFPHNAGETVVKDTDLSARCRNCGKSGAFHTLIGSFCSADRPTFDPAP